jgi:hypothetical protein
MLTYALFAWPPASAELNLRAASLLTRVRYRTGSKAVAAQIEPREHISP